MQQLETVNLSGKDFQLFPLPLFTRVRLDIRVTRILAPMIAGLGVAESLDIKEIVSHDLDMTKLAKALERAFESISEHELTQLMREVLNGTTVSLPGTAPFTLGSDTSFEQAFGDNHFDIYRLFISALRSNKIVPFGLGGIGSLIGKAAS